MTKKIFDIIPPEEKSSFKEDVKIKGKDKTKKNHKGKNILILVVSFVFLFVALANFVFAEFNIKILPETEQVNFERKIIVGDNADVFGKIIEEEKEIWQEFSSTGKLLKEEKAKGKIKVFNTHNPPKSLTLRAKTRFLSDSGKYFYSPEKIYIPPAKIEKGKIVPSFVEIEIVAMEAGEDYNIKPATFSIPGLVGTSYYYSTYGKSSSNMKGGFKKEVSQVLQEDLDNAKDILEKRALKECEISLKDKVSSDFILLDDAFTQEIIKKDEESSSLIKAGAELEIFNISVKVYSKALIFKESDLLDFSRKLILSQVSEEKEIIEHSLVSNYFFENIDMKAIEMALDLKVSSKIYSHIDLEFLKALVAGKPINEVESILKERLDVISLETNFFPFWLKSIPKDIERIKIELELD